jgi:hypothetical protein
MDKVFEEIEQLKRFDESPTLPVSVKFLRYVETRLTGGKADPHHNISFKSSLARIPGSTNTKDAGGEEVVVEIKQAWNKVLAEPTEDFMITDFILYLAEQALDEKKKRIKEQLAFGRHSSSYYDAIARPTTTNNNRLVIAWQWVENILSLKPIDDWRKKMVALVLSRYLIIFVD